jgi:glycosyltransferase involved in cell wall biosynthesis
MRRLYFAVDPLHMVKGAVAPAIELAKYFAESYRWDVTLLALFGEENIVEKLREQGINVYTLKKKFVSLTKIPTFEAWLRAIMKASLGFGDHISDIISEEAILINTSSTIAMSFAHIYYGLGPMTYALYDMLNNLSIHLRLPLIASLPIMGRVERKFISYITKSTKINISISRFAKTMYERMGVKINGVIHAPLDCRKFKPSTKKPSADYIITYLGPGSKEGNPHIIKTLANKGLKIKVFGMKAVYIPDFLRNHPNIEFLGYVNDEELVDLYSNALYTLFTFAHEPFGYVPVESMACCTPVLTYNRQGPSETVVNGITGWLANSDEELIELAIRIWKNGYPSWMRSRCRERALEFDVKVIAGKWFEVLKEL